MLYLANPCGPAVIAAMEAGTIGYIDTPAQGNKRPSGVAWCADNGAFSDKFDEAKWWKFLTDNAHDAGTCLFAVAPDVVGDAEATLTRSAPWLPKIRALGYPASFVAQNGVEHVSVPWDEFDVLFIGGCVECPDHGPTLHSIKTGRGASQRFYCPECREEIFEWKDGPIPRDVAAEAKRRGKRVHCGRVNGEKRFRYAAAPYPYGLGADSADGTFLTRAPLINLPRLKTWLRSADQGAFEFGDIA